MMEEVSNMGDKRIPFFDFIQEYHIDDEYAFLTYLELVFKDLNSKSSNPRNKYSGSGISKLCFLTYFDLPGIIGERLFSVMAKHSKKYISRNDFLEGMLNLFSGNYHKLTKFIFNLYDFDDDDLISRKDIQKVFSYLPLKNASRKVSNSTSGSNSTKFSDFGDRIHSQLEIRNNLGKIFPQNQEFLTYSMFLERVENASSEFFIYVLLFIYERRPFINELLSFFKNISVAKTDETIRKQSDSNILNFKIATPTVQSKFSLFVRKERNKKCMTSIIKSDSKIQIENGRAFKVLERYCHQNKQEESSTSDSEADMDENIQIGTIRIQTMKNKEMIEDSLAKEKSTTLSNQPNFHSPSTRFSTLDEETEVNTPKVFVHVGELSKFSNGKFITEKFTLYNQNLIYSKQHSSPCGKKLINLSGAFLKIEKKRFIHEKCEFYYCFSLSFNLGQRHFSTKYYFSKGKEDFKNWVKILKNVVKHDNMREKYTLGSGRKIGSGKFGKVVEGMDKLTGEKVAIKLLEKESMSESDLILVRNEIETLKICQHPNIIKFNEVYESADYYYLVMEYCPYGDLLSYVQDSSRHITEAEAAQIVFNLSSALEYLDSFGIIHRDIKLENVLIKNITEKNNSLEFDIRLIDFGLAKFLGPSEMCKDPFGTLGYVAPEILLNHKYNSKVDIWSLGIVSFYLLSGYLPFDHVGGSCSEIAKKTLFASPYYNEFVWDEISTEGKDFIHTLLQKQAESRPYINDVFTHPWLVKFLAQHSKLNDFRVLMGDKFTESDFNRKLTIPSSSDFNEIEYFSS